MYQCFKSVPSVKADRLRAAITSVNATLSVLKKYRNNSIFHGHFETASSLADMLGVDTPTVLSTRRKRVSQWVDQMWQSEHQHETVESKYRVEFYFQVLDCLIEQIEQQFSQETQSLLVSTSNQKSCLRGSMNRNVMAT